MSDQYKCQALGECMVGMALKAISFHSSLHVTGVGRQYVTQGLGPCAIGTGLLCVSPARWSVDGLLLTLIDRYFSAPTSDSCLPPCRLPTMCLCVCVPLQDLPQANDLGLPLGPAGDPLQPVSSEELQALFESLQPDVLRETLEEVWRDDAPSSSQPHTALVQDVVQKLQGQGRKGLKPLYFQCSLQDRAGVGGITDADVAVDKAIAAYTGCPSGRTAAALEAAAPYMQQLEDLAQNAANPHVAKALWLRYLALKLWSFTGEMLTPSAKRMCVLLCGDAGTDTLLHTDPVGAGTLAIPVTLRPLTAEQLVQLLRSVLARWMFASPRLFAEPRERRLFLLVLQRIAELQQQYSDLQAKREAALKVANRANCNQQLKAKKEAEAAKLQQKMSALEPIATSAEQLQREREQLLQQRAKLEEQLLQQREQQRAQQEQQQGLQKAAVQQLTPQEAKDLQGCFSGEWRPLPWLLLFVQGVMGKEYIVILDQKAGQCWLLVHRGGGWWGVF